MRELAMLWVNLPFGVRGRVGSHTKYVGTILVGGGGGGGGVGGGKFMVPERARTSATVSRHFSLTYTRRAGPWCLRPLAGPFPSHRADLPRHGAWRSEGAPSSGLQSRPAQCHSAVLTCSFGYYPEFMRHQRSSERHPRLLLAGGGLPRVDDSAAGPFVRGSLAVRISCVSDFRDEFRYPRASHPPPNTSHHDPCVHGLTARRGYRPGVAHDFQLAQRVRNLSLAAKRWNHSPNVASVGPYSFKSPRPAEFFLMLRASRS